MPSRPRPFQSAWFGGTDNEGALALAVHPSSGEVYVYGTTETMTGLPSVAGGAIATFVGSGGFVARFDAGLATRFQSTYLPNASGAALAFAPTATSMRSAARPVRCPRRRAPRSPIRRAAATRTCCAWMPA